MRLDLLSPLPPVRSGIADYSADLLPHLAGLAELRLGALEGQAIAEAIARDHEVVPASRIGEGGGLALYQMGNNRYHVGVYERAMERPGILTLHDLVLHHFLLDHTFNRGSFEAYRERLVREHGWMGAAAAGPIAWPGGHGSAAQFALPANRLLLARQLGVLVHSPWAADWLREELPGLRVRAVPMGVPLGPEASEAAGRAFRGAHGLPAAAPVLGAFGFQTPIKRTDVAIRALASEPLAEAHLIVAGEVAPAFELEDLARRLGVAERVCFLGFLPFEELLASIAASDLCLNLRYPSAGETSASLLRVLAMGRGAVVSDYAQFAELDSAAILRVPLGAGDEKAEAEALAAAVAELLVEPGRLLAMGREARRLVAREHDPVRAARAVVEACRELSEEAAHARSLPLPAVPPPTSIAWDRLEGELAVEGAEAPWPEGRRRRLRIRLANRGAARWLAGERGPGGVAIEVQLLAAGEDLRAGRSWIGLPFDLEPGEEHVFELSLRRPLGPARLRVLPHALAHTGFSDLGGPVWEAEL